MAVMFDVGLGLEKDHKVPKMVCICQLKDEVDLGGVLIPLYRKITLATDAFVMILVRCTK